MSKRGKSAIAGFGVSKQHPPSNDAPPPEPEDKAFVAKIERRIAAYQPDKGEMDLKVLGIGPDHLNWVAWRLKSLPGLTTLDISGNAIGAAGAGAGAGC